MSTALAPTTTAVPARRLVVIHGDGDRSSPAGRGPQHPTGAAALTALQEELPLRWPLDRNGEAAARGLRAYPDLPLDPGVPRPEPFVAHAATLIADVLTGARPATQLRRCAVLDVCQRLGRRSAARREQGTWTGSPAQVTSTSTMVVAGTAVQVVAVFRTGRRAHGAAIRMEYRHGRWLVTDVQSPA